MATYKDLGSFQLLLSLQDDDALMSYCRGVLGPVEQTSVDMEREGRRGVAELIADERDVEPLCDQQ